LPFFGLNFQFLGVYLFDYMFLVQNPVGQKFKKKYYGEIVIKINAEKLKINAAGFWHCGSST